MAPLRAPRSAAAASLPRPASRFLPEIALDPSLPKEAASNTATIPPVNGHPGPQPKLTEAVALRPLLLSYTPSTIETATSVQLKYAVLLDTDVELLPDPGFLEKIDPWLGVPYRSGGSTTNGIDCSAFTMTIYAQYCGWQLPRTSRQQYAYCAPADTAQLSPGDLLFYSIRGRGVSHVGIYLGNRKFVHASVSSGVTVSDVDDPYYQKRFVAAGRVPVAER